MLKRINVQSLLQARDSLSEAGFAGFLKHYGIEIKDAEFVDLKNLAEGLCEKGCRIVDFEGFYLGYSIPQIGKEFDLLRFGREYIINIELKSNSTEIKIKNQLSRNKYYLNFIGRKIYAFTYVSESQDLYFFGDDQQLSKVELSHLVELLAKQRVDEAEVPDTLFNPSDYLVSPFNCTKSFLAGEYFLTQQQEKIRNQILDGLEPKCTKFVSIVGGAGTGKTLLIYDIAKHLIENKKNPLIIHCGQLNNGQNELIENQWAISPIKSFAKHDFANYDLVILDEAQRIRPSQLDTVTEKVRLAGCCCIFSHDKLQTLASWEEALDISAKIGSLKSLEQYKLSEKIRTNREIAEFIKMLFNKKKSTSLTNCGNIEIAYFQSNEDAKSYLETLDRNKWEILRFTPSQYNIEHHKVYSDSSNKTSHEIIGQEFDGVTVTIDQYFSYDENGNLTYKSGAYYHPAKMLFQNITRARKRLNLVIINNAELLSRCIEILQ